MKRAPELRTLSEDHHHGLVHARRLRKAAAGEEHPAQRTARAFLDFWRKDTSLHFRREEEALLPVMARYGEDVGQEPIAKMLRQHAEIRGLVMTLSDEVRDDNIRTQTLREIGERLEAHIRLEERVVFPLVEESLSNPALTEIAARLEVREAPPGAERWVPAEGLFFAPWPGPGDSEGGGYD